MKIKCCILDRKSNYRGIDREVDMRVFNKAKNLKTYNYALELYIQYMSVEEVYTSENLSVIDTFAKIVKNNYSDCEVVLFCKSAIADLSSLELLGIDIVDEHMASVLKNRRFLKKNGEINQYGLYSTYATARSVVQHMQKQNLRYGELYCGYVYKIVDLLGVRFDFPKDY